MKSYFLEIFYLLLIISTAFFLLYITEKRIWNKGRCKKCGNIWEEAVTIYDKKDTKAFRCKCDYQYFMFKRILKKCMNFSK